MPKTKTMIIIAIILFIIALTASLFLIKFLFMAEFNRQESETWVNSNKMQKNIDDGTKKAEEAEIRDFACEGMSGFSFQYPVFEDWKPQIMPGSLVAQNGVCKIDLPRNYPPEVMSESFPGITVQKIAYEKKESKTSADANKKINPNDVPYILEFDKELNTVALTFYANDFKVKVYAYYNNDKLAKDIKPFDQNKFFQTVINSFKV